MVRKGIGTDTRIGSKFIYPGVGYGGSCFPKDVKALIALSKQYSYDFNILKEVEEVNKQMRRLFIEKIRKQGLRNSHLLSIQPTGNSSILANIVSGGLEPIFMPEYKRTSIMPYPPNGLDIPHNIDWVNKTYTSNTK
jgi:ribonucleotide reductase alpha subunit